MGEKSRLERLGAYEEFASLVMLLAIGLGGTAELESMMRSLHRLEIRVSPDTGAAARELFLACTKLVTEGQKPDETRDEKEVRRLSNQVYELRNKLVALAQKENISSEVSLVQKPKQ